MLWCGIVRVWAAADHGVDQRPVEAVRRRHDDVQARAVDAQRAGAAERVEQVERLVLLQRQACADEGALSFVTTIRYSYRDSPYKRE